METATYTVNAIDPCVAMSEGCWFMSLSPVE